MGKNKRIKKYRKLIKAKLDKMELKNQTVLVASGTLKNMVEFQTDSNGNFVLNENGKPVLKKVSERTRHLSNPYKSTLKKLLNSEEAVIKQFLKQE